MSLGFSTDRAAEKNKLKSVKNILSDAYQNDRMTLNSTLILIHQVVRVDS